MDGGILEPPIPQPLSGAPPRERGERKRLAFLLPELGIAHAATALLTHPAGLASSGDFLCIKYAPGECGLCGFRQVEGKSLDDSIWTHLVPCKFPLSAGKGRDQEFGCG